MAQQGILMRWFDMLGLVKSRYGDDRVRAITVQQEYGGWTVLWETKHAYGTMGWNMTAAAATILAHRIESGEIEV
jgi:hypothetical protein